MVKPKGNHAFLKKVYDKYNNSDYSFGDDNLNPKRELTLDSFEEEKILKRVQQRFNDIEDTLRDIPFKEPENLVKFPFNDYPAFVPKSSLPKIVVPGVTSYPSPDFPAISSLENQVSDMIKKIELSGPFDKVPDGTENLMKLDCNGLSYEQIVAGKGNNGGNSGKGKDDLTEDKVTDGAQPESTDDGNGQEGDNGKESPENPLPLAECALLDLWWLKIVLIVLRIIKLLMLVVSLVFAIVIPIMKMTRDTCVCWIDPPALSCAIGMTAELIISIVFTVISIIVTIIFALLKFDCITDVSQEILDACREAFTGVCGGIELGMTLAAQGEEMSEIAKKNKANKKSAKEWWAEQKKAREDAKAAGITNRMSAETLEELINMGVEATNSVLDTFGVNPTEMLNQGVKNLDDMTTKQSELLNKLGVSNQLSPSNMLSSTYNIVKQVIKISDSASGKSEIHVDTSGLSKTKKKIQDSWERFKALCKSPYNKVKSIVDKGK